MLQKFDNEKRRQLIIMAGVGAVALGVVYFLFHTTGPKQPTKPPIHIQGLKKTQEETTAQLYNMGMQQMQAKIDELQKEIKQLKQNNSQSSNNNNNNSTPSSQKPTGLPALKQLVPPKAHGSAPPPPPPPPPNMPSQPPAPPPPPQVLHDVIGIVHGSPTAYNVPPSNNPSPQNKPQGKPFYSFKPNPNEKPKVVTIPAGSFVRARLLSGADVPTAGAGTGKPTPVLLQIVGINFLPNKWRANIRGCFLLGSASGDLSSQRAYFDIDKLSCVTKTGKPLSIKVHAYVTGEDGKVGLAGRVVSKQGAILARTLLAGILQGFAQVYQTQAYSLNTTPLGTVSALNPSNATQYGFANGLSTAAQELAKFYMKMANQMFPVIEINAGRSVDVIFDKSVRF